MNRVVHCEDALAWLESREPLLGHSFVSSLPDFSEFPNLTLIQWQEWFTNAAKLIMSKCDPDGVTIFYQSDIKVDCTWIDKGYLCQKAAVELDQKLLWHKIICRAPAGMTTFGRPSYSHMLAFSKNVRPPIDMSTADVIPDLGERVWQRGMGLNACLVAAKFISDCTATKTIVNPFCGHGSMLAAANFYNLSAVGIERSTKRASKAMELQIAKDGKSWEE